ncbi:unnamed protein product [Ambrosiozyma monospora]|uniref:Unnamed protein product n=1 Tax=Ambrosiozyma monospora TaxID=43982 RepID=A0ACB5TK26_AMBMO|nr:unnamed protein product [Ambrosiozyma monospora]
MLTKLVPLVDYLVITVLQTTLVDCLEPATGTTGGLFGNNNISSNTTGGLFGNKPAGTTGGLFGNNQQQTQTGGGLFGMVNQQQQQQQQQQQAQAIASANPYGAGPLFANASALAQPIVQTAPKPVAKPLGNIEKKKQNLSAAYRLSPKPLFSPKEVLLSKSGSIVVKGASSPGSANTSLVAETTPASPAAKSGETDKAILSSYIFAPSRNVTKLVIDKNKQRNNFEGLKTETILHSQKQVSFKVDLPKSEKKQEDDDFVLVEKPDTPVESPKKFVNNTYPIVTASTPVTSPPPAVSPAKPVPAPAAVSPGPVKEKPLTITSLPNDYYTSPSIAKLNQILNS